MRSKATPRVAAPLAWSDKAATLLALAARVRTVRVPDSLVLTHTRWRADAAGVRREVRARFGRARLAVRSARAGEDAPGSGDAGRYESVLGVRDMRALGRAVRRVFESYGAVRPHDAVLIQPCVASVSAALVAANRAADGAPYDAISRAAVRDSTAITRGSVAAETWYIGHGTRRVPRALRAIVNTVREVEALLGPQPFELELVLARGTLWLLQARRIPAPRTPPATSHARLRRRAQSELVRMRDTGMRALGLMPDWNPAELIGEHPRPLALGLFDATIAQRTWALARAALGYATPYRAALLRPLAGRPYVDVRASFESLVPAATPARVRARLVAHWLARLAADPSLHDKVEFEIATTCRELDLAWRLRACPLSGSERGELEAALVTPTVRALDARALDAEIATFERRCVTGSVPLALKGIARDVALPFARAARRDFVATALLRSAVRRGALGPCRLEGLLHDVHHGARALAHGDVLRPGTFEIECAPCRAPDFVQAPLPSADALRLSASERRGLDALLREASLPLDANALVSLAARAMRARELGKRVLAAALDEWLARLTDAGAARGLGADVLGWLTPQQARAALGDPERGVAAAVRARTRHATEAALRLPPVLTATSDLALVRHPPCAPNWLGTERVDAPLELVDRHTQPHTVTAGKAIAIRSADPGYDWIFARAPAALITAYGGPHSHMALRCAGARVPAALGLGPERFGRLLGAARVTLDPRLGVLEARTG